jgi:hypothetical protein
MTLPWDRFTPDEPAAPSSPPLTPAPPTPSVPAAPAPPPPQPPPPGMDVGAIIGASVKAAVNELLPALKDQAAGYIRETGQAAKRGDTVDHQHPTITATTAAGRELVVADAKSRGWRTFLQGLAIDVFAALLAILGTLTGLDPFAQETWVIVGALAVKTLIQTVISYIARLQVTPTIRNPEGDKMALMPVPRPMLASDKITRRSDHDAELAPAGA